MQLVDPDSWTDRSRRSGMNHTLSANDFGTYQSSNCSFNMSTLNSTFSPNSTLSAANFSSSFGGQNCNDTPEDNEIFPTVGYPVLVLEFAKILYGIVFLVGLFGNTLVIYVVMRFSKMQTVTNMYIFNLAVADEMFLVGLPFLITTVIYKVLNAPIFHWLPLTSSITFLFVCPVLVIRAIHV